MVSVVAATLISNGVEASPLETWRSLRDGRGTPDQYQQFLKKHADWPDKNGLVAAGEKAILSKPMLAKRDVTWFSLNPPTTSSGHMRYVEALQALKRKDIAHAVQSAWQQGIDTLDERTFHGKWAAHLRPQDYTERQYRMMLNGSNSPIAQKKSGKTYACADDYARIKEHLKARRYQEAEDLLRKHLPEIRSATPRMADVWWKLCHAVARECIERKDYATALSFVENHDLPEGTEDWATAEWTRGWLLWHTDRYADAYSAFVNVYNKVKAPMSRSRMAFWAAESAKRAHMEAQVTEWHQKSAQYGLTFYGQLSARYLNQPVGDLFWADNKAVPDASVKKDDLHKVITGKEELSKDEKLLFFGAWVKRLHRSHDPNDPIFAYAVQLAKQKGGNPLAVPIMRLVNFVSPKLVRSAFPKLPEVSSDIAVLANAIAWRESGFDPQAVSSAGAIGYMQMMPGTFEKEKRQMPNAPAGTVYTPTANIAVGTFLIKRLMQEYPHILLMLSAYNAGEDPVKRWREVFGEPPSMEADPVEIADWIEKIPYYETRNYVQRVLEKVYVYQLILKDENKH